MSNYNDDRPVVQNTYVPPVAEAVVEQRSFLSRFWWLLPLLALLIALPFILRGCRHEEAPVTAAPVGQCAPGTNLTLDTFANAAPQTSVIQAFEAAHNVTVTVNNYPESTDALQAYLSGFGAGGAGVGDVIMVEGDHWAAATVHPDDFVPLPEIPGRWLGWAQDEARINGVLYGYRTDISPVSIMYNARLLEEHGFGQYADPEAFSQWIGGNNATWDTYLAAGRQWTEATGLAWVDSISDGPLRAALRQMPSAFEDPTTGLARPLADNTAVHNVFLQMGEAMQEGLGAGIPFWNGDWGAGALAGDFVTFVAPAWMMGWPLMPAYSEHPDADYWRIATVFPNGGANWGGTFAAVPAHGNHIECAVLLADWITNDDAARANWENAGAFPSQAHVLDEGIAATPAQLHFFGNQNVAEVFTGLAEDIPSAGFRGENFSWIQDTAIFNNLATVQDGINTPAQAWDNAVAEFNAQGFNLHN